MLETVPKALASSCMAHSLAMLEEAPLAKALLLLGHPVPSSPPLPDHENISAWSMNPSQLDAVHHALLRPFTVVQGPPGTGKTRTTAVLAALLAKRNLKAGENHAVLFCAPTNRAVDCAASFVAQVCSEQATAQLHERQADVSNVCAVCLLA